MFFDLLISDVFFLYNNSVRSAASLSLMRFEPIRSESLDFGLFAHCLSLYQVWWFQLFVYGSWSFVIKLHRVLWQFPRGLYSVIEIGLQALLDLLTLLLGLA